MRKLLTALAVSAALLVGAAPSMACDTISCSTTAQITNKVIAPAAVVGMFALNGYMIWATENNVNIGQTQEQKAEHLAAVQVMNRYQTTPAFTAQATLDRWVLAGHDPRLLTHYAFAAVPSGDAALASATR
jgi:hypothetical protein